MDAKRLNLTVDAEAGDILEKMAGGRNKMGDHLAKLLKSLAAGTPADEIERMDKESLRLMIQGLAGRVLMLEGEVMRIQAQLATLIADRTK